MGFRSLEMPSRLQGGSGLVLHLVIVVLVLEVAGQDAHADQVGAMDALEGLGDDGLHAEQRGALRCPVAAGAPVP